MSRRRTPKRAHLSTIADMGARSGGPERVEVSPADDQPTPRSTVPTPSRVHFQLQWLQRLHLSSNKPQEMTCSKV